MSFAPVLVRLTPLRKLLAALLSVISPAPALIAIAPMLVLIAPVCVMPEPAVSDSPPVAPAVMLTPDSNSPPLSRMAMSFAPVLVRLTPLRKLLPALFSAIMPAPALMVTAPVFEWIDPVCVRLPLLTMVSVVPQLMGDMVMPLNTRSFMSRIDTFRPWPWLFRLTAPRKSFAALSRMIAPLFASKVTSPMALKMGPVCRIDPPALTVRLPALGMVTPESVSAPLLRIEMSAPLFVLLNRLTAPRKSLPALFSVIEPRFEKKNEDPATVIAPVWVIASCEVNDNPFTLITRDTTRFPRVLRCTPGTSGCTGLSPGVGRMLRLMKLVCQTGTVFVRDTGPPKLFLPCESRISPASAWMVT